MAADEISSDVPPAGQPTAGAEGSGPHNSAWPLVAISVGYFMVILDTMVVNVALPALSRSLHTTTTGLQWVVDAYSLVFAALLLSAGALGDRRGAKAVFQGGIALFALASLACGLAPSTGALIAARAAQGIGAALAVPASLALLAAAYRDLASRRRAFGIWGAVAGIAAGAGPVVGGALVSGLGWRSVFFLNVPVGVAGLALAARVLPSPVRRPHGADPAGQIAGIAALGGLTFALIEAGSAGWGAPVVLAGFAVFAAGAAVFVAIERRVTGPMLPLSLFSSATFSAATTVGLLINLGFYGELFVMSLYLQAVRGLSPLLAGVALVPEAAMAVVGSTASGRVVARTGPRLPMLLGLCLGSAGLFGLLAVGAHSAYALLVAPFMATGLGMSLTMPAATAAVMEAAPAERGGLASGTVNAARQVGGVIGVALLGSLVARRASFIPGLHAGMVIAGGAFLAGAALSALGVERRHVTGAPTPSRPGRTTTTVTGRTGVSSRAGTERARKVRRGTQDNLAPPVGARPWWRR
ncbi:MAG: MFS transporter [Actinomycetota bacterium]|nr:MFS transporter [Actinomycetota bacterium]